MSRLKRCAKSVAPNLPSNFDEEISRRLEMLRIAFGFESVREFWIHLGGDAPVYGEGQHKRSRSLAVVRNYHRGISVVPTRYIQRVMQVFPSVDPDWLIAKKPIIPMRPNRPAQFAFGHGPPVDWLSGTSSTG